MGEKLDFSSQFKVKKVFDLLDEKLDMTDFEDRVHFQKIVYLFQAVNEDLDYHFRWYLHGPYSTELADDGFTLHYMREKTKEKISKYAELTHGQEDAARLKGFLDELSKLETSLDRHELLELAASVHFLYTHTYRSSQNCSFVAEQLERRKPEFKSGVARRICKLLRKHELVG